MKIDSNRHNSTTTKVNIKLYASRLKNVAGFLKGTSDPYAVVTLLASGPNEKPRVLGKTEVVKNNLSPDWITQFSTDYVFGKETRINVAIFDEVRKTGKHISMGSSQFEIGEVLGSRGNIKAKGLKTGGSLFCRVTKAVEEDYGVLRLQLRGEDFKVIDGGGLFGKKKPDPFFVINAQAAHTGGNRVWNREYRSEVVSESDQPEWNVLEIPVERICGGDRGRAIQIETYCWVKNGKHRQIGKLQTSVDGLLQALSMPDRGLELTYKGRATGTILVSQAAVVGGSSMLPPSAPSGFTASAPPLSFASAVPPVDTFSGLTSSVPATNHHDDGLLPTPLPPPMVPSMSSYPIAASESASSLPPAMPPPAFDASDGPQFGHSADISEGMEAVEISSRKTPARPGITKKPDFIDYLSGGLEMNLSIAIDFTGSNGDPRQPGTLHHIHHNGELNDYEKAITAVGSIISKYDSDQRFPLFGFGAKFNGKIEHCFPIGHPTGLVGVKGVLEGYRSVFNSGLVMSGPTVFAKVIDRAAIEAQQEFERKQANGQQSYSILLIVTDGAVTDEQQTRVALKLAHTAPLSIVIVGVGDADFSKMNFLDSVHNTDPNMRDIVKFVEFNKYRLDRQGLTLETLSEIPNQVVQYYQEKGIHPLPSIDGSRSNLTGHASSSSADDFELDFQFAEDGTIQLTESDRAFWDARLYGNATSFTTKPRIPMSHDTTRLENNYESTRNGQLAPITLSPGREKPKLTPYVTAPSAPIVDEMVVQVKVPANAQPGMQLRVRNPTSGNEKIVAVPMGVRPGGTFTVRV